MKKEKQEEIITQEKDKEGQEEVVNEELTEEMVSLTKEEIEAMNKKANDAEEKFLRAQADLINYRKRKDEETNRLLKFANEDLITEILPIIDNFERALSLESSDTKLLDGMKMVYNTLLQTLEKYGVKEIESLGKPFDPMVHNAVLTETDDSKEQDTILEVLQKGYILKDKVIRPAMVKVNK